MKYKHWVIELKSGQHNDLANNEVNLFHLLDLHVNSILPIRIFCLKSSNMMLVRLEYLSILIIIYLQRFLLEHGGTTGNWDDYDHGTFLRIRNKYKVVDELTDQTWITIDAPSV